MFKRIDHIALDVADIERSIGLNVNIQNKKNNSGKLIIEYKNLDQLEMVSKLLKKR